jgi:glycine dehydrogenase subunit 2
MIEPTETESREDIDLLVDALKAIAEEARNTPDILREAPHRCKVRRLDETTAARHPCLTG